MEYNFLPATSGRKRPYVSYHESASLVIQTYYPLRGFYFVYIDIAGIPAVLVF